MSLFLFVMPDTDRASPFRHATLWAVAHTSEAALAAELKTP